MVKVSLRHSAEMAALHQTAKMSMKDIIAKFPQYGQATVYRHAQKEINGAIVHDKRKHNKGRPTVVSQQDRRAILRAIPKLRKTEGSFSSPRVAVQAGVAQRLSNRTVRRVMNNAGYHYRQSRKKGLLLSRDLKARKQFCQRIRKLKLTQEFWTKHIAFYFDGKGFQYKTHPLDQARAPKRREWRLKSEGLKFGCTAKGCKEGAVNANFLVGISYDHGVVLCEQYHGPISGKKVAHVVRNAFPAAFANSIDPIGKRFLQDGCPRQNSKLARDAFQDVQAMPFKIPARSPDLNPIENFFHLVGKKLSKEVIERNIEKETFTQFSERCKRTMLDFPIATINNLIDSMDKRITMVFEAGGMRIRY